MIKFNFKRIFVEFCFLLTNDGYGYQILRFDRIFYNFFLKFENIYESQVFINKKLLETSWFIMISIKNYVQCSKFWRPFIHFKYFWSYLNSKSLLIYIRLNSHKTTSNIKTGLTFWPMSNQPHLLNILRKLVF